MAAHVEVQRFELHEYIEEDSWYHLIYSTRCCTLLYLTITLMSGIFHEERKKKLSYSDLVCKPESYDIISKIILSQLLSLLLMKF